jgi:hypothetical protein
MLHHISHSVNGLFMRESACLRTSLAVLKATCACVSNPLKVFLIHVRIRSEAALMLKSSFKLTKDY